jgi:hypothetical protein
MRNLCEIEDRQVNQLELGFAGRRNRRQIRQHRTQRAQWWFARMRQAVDRAVGWPAIPPAPPEQVYLTLAGRQS